MRTCTTFEGSFFSCYTIVQRKVPLTAEEGRLGRLLADEGLREARCARLALHRVGLALTMKREKYIFLKFYYHPNHQRNEHGHKPFRSYFVALFKD